MRTMKNFAAQQHSMQQMMQILGGKYQVSVYAADGRFLNRITVDGVSSSREAAELVLSLYGPGHYAIAGRIVE